MAKESVTYEPDILEWRMDYFDQGENISKVLDTARQLRMCVGDQAVMATLRHPEENGVREVLPGKKLKLLKALICSKTVDMVDVELRYGKEYISALKKVCRVSNTALMVSYHDLHHTPDDAEVLSILRQETGMGGQMYVKYLLWLKPMQTTAALEMQ